jgi:O-methyltransferase
MKRIILIIGIVLQTQVFSNLTEYIKKSVLKEEITIIPEVRLNSLIKLMGEVTQNNIQGDFLEAGAMRGGACMVMRAFCKENLIDKNVYVADSFKGFPPTKFINESYVNNLTYPFVVVSKEQVMKNFAKYDLLDDKVFFIEGFFSESLPKADISKLSILRIDCDMYQSTLDVLENLYSKVSDGGYVIIDDYGDFPYCRLAVDEFRTKLNITSL